MLRHTFPVRDHAVEILVTERSDGDFSIGSEGVDQRRESFCGRPVTWLNLCHGTDVVTVGNPGGLAGSFADGAATKRMDAALAVTTADCAPVVLMSSNGISVVHAGWKGLTGGVLQQAVAVLKSFGGRPVGSWCGPCIAPSDYEFSVADLDDVADVLGPTVRAETSWGTPALDMFQGVVQALASCDWPSPTPRPPSTAQDVFFSHRLRTDPQRMMTAAWMTPLIETHG